MVYYSLYRFPVYLERDQQPEPRSLSSGRGAHARNKGNEKKKSTMFRGLPGVTLCNGIASNCKLKNNMAVFL